MKIPLSFQRTSFDCGPTSLMNAISYLFEREEIPAEIIKDICLYSLDCYDEKGNRGQKGTSRSSITLITDWLNDFSKTKGFNLACEKLVGKEITIAKLKKCVDTGGVILARLWLDVEHYVIVTSIDDKDIYIFDPYYLAKDYYEEETDVRIVFNKPFSHNRIVKIKRFTSTTKKDFSLGKIENRECVLMKKL